MTEIKMRPEVGDRVRVTVEGVYRRSGEDCGYLTKGDDATWATFNDSVVVAMERLPDPEPEWRVGDVARPRCSGLSVVVRGSDDRWRDRNGVILSESYPNTNCCRPLTLLVRDGKPVAASVPSKTL